MVKAKKARGNKRHEGPQHSNQEALHTMQQLIIMVKAKKARGNKRHEGPQHSNQEALHTMQSPDLSAIDRASFMDSAESYGRGLHSTALEDDLSLPAHGEMDGAEEGGTEKAQEEEGGTDGAEEEGGTDGAEEEGGTDGAQEEGGGLDKGTRDKEKKSTGKKVGDGCVTEEGKNDGRKRKMKRKNVRMSGADSENQESGSSRPAAVLSTDDENAGPKSSAKKSRNTKSSSDDGSGNRKSSSDGRNPRKQRTMNKTITVSTDSESPGVDQKTKRGRSRGKATELEVVLDAFLAFCHQYRESVESKAVRKAIDSFSSGVEEILTKKITVAKELRVLMRDNAKVDSLIRKKRRKLLDAKDELIEAERQVGLMRKEEARLTQRLDHVRKGRTFLSGMSELTKRYLDHRSAHPQEKEEYGASSLPALLLETKYILGTENQLRQINDQLEARLKETGK